MYLLVKIVLTLIKTSNPALDWLLRVERIREIALTLAKNCGAINLRTGPTVSGIYA